MHHGAAFVGQDPCDPAKCDSVSSMYKLISGMSILRRYYADGQSYFVTNVTFQRMPLLKENYDLLWEAIATVRERLPFDLVAHVFLPDHFHAIIDPMRNDLSDIMHRIKLSFFAQYRKRHYRHSGRLWQSRFWDHVVRNQDDMNKHLDYIHYNPVKHGLVDSPLDYPHSSLARFGEGGYYSADWGCQRKLSFGGEFGDD